MIRPNNVDGTTAVENLGLVRQDMQAFQYRAWFGSGDTLYMVVQSVGVSGDDMAAIQLALSPAINFSPFSFDAASDGALGECPSENVGNAVVARPQIAGSATMTHGVEFVDKRTCFQSAGIVSAYSIYAHAVAPGGGSTIQLGVYRHGTGAVYQKIAAAPNYTGTGFGVQLVAKYGDVPKCVLKFVGYGVQTKLGHLYLPGCVRDVYTGGHGVVVIGIHRYL